MIWIVQFLALLSCCQYSRSEDGKISFLSKDRKVDVPRVDIYVPDRYNWFRPKRQPQEQEIESIPEEQLDEEAIEEALVEDEMKNVTVVKEDPSEVEVFPVKQIGIDPHGPRDFEPFDPYTPGVPNPESGINPLFPGSSIDAFTVRRAVDLEILPGRKMRFLDTVTQVY